MNDSPAEVLKVVLVGAGVFADPDASSSMPAWPLFVGLEPDEADVPDECGTVYDLAARDDGRIMRTGEKIEHFGLQLRVRTPARNQQDGWRKTEEARLVCQAVMNASVVVGSTGYRVDNLSPQGGTLYIGQEQAGRRRRLHVLNLLATIRTSP